MNEVQNWILSTLKNGQKDRDLANKKNATSVKIIVAIKGFDFVRLAPPFLKSFFYESWTWAKVEKVLTMRTLTVSIHHCTFEIFWLEKTKRDSFDITLLFCTHIVWKLLKMSHLNVSILASSTNFCPIKTDLSGNTVWPQALGFQKLAKMDHFWPF